MSIFEENAVFIAQSKKCVRDQDKAFFNQKYCYFSYSSVKNIRECYG